MYFGKFPGESPGAKRIFLYREGLQAAGTDCDIIPVDIASEGRLNRLWQALAIPIIGFIRAYNHLNHNSICLVYTSKWLCILMSYLACKLRKSKIVLEVNEKPCAPYGDRLSELVIIKLCKRFFIEHLVYPLLDGFIVISENLHRYVTGLKSTKAKIIKVPIIINPDLNLKTIELPVDIEKPFIIHAGALSEKKDGVLGICEAVDLANQNRDKKIHVYFTHSIAPTDVKCRLKKISENTLEGLIHFIGNIPNDELAAYQKNCSMLVLFKPDNEQNQYNFSTKLGEFLAFNKPVIFTPVGELTSYLKDQINAIQVSTYTPFHLAEKIKYVLDRQDIAEKLGIEAGKLAKTDFHYKVQGKRLAAYFSHPHFQSN